MKRIILFIGLFLLTVNLIGQTGTGWAQQRAKMNFKDSTNFVKSATFENTIIMNGSDAGSTTLRPFTTASGTLVYPTSAGTDTIATRAYARSYGGTGSSFAWIDSANIYTREFNIIDYGAVEGSGDDAAAIQAAIEAAAAWVSAPTAWEAAGTVIIPAGEWNLSTAIILRSHVNIKVDNGARITVPDSYTGAVFTNPTDEALLGGSVSGGIYYCGTNTYKGILLKSMSSSYYVMFTSFSNMYFIDCDTALTATALTGSTGWITGVNVTDMVFWQPHVGFYAKGSGSSYPISLNLDNVQVQGDANTVQGIQLDNYARNNRITRTYLWDVTGWHADAKTLTISSLSSYNYVTGSGVNEKNATNLGYSNYIENRGHPHVPDSLVIWGNVVKKDYPAKLKIIGYSDNGSAGSPAGDIGIQIKSQGASTPEDTQNRTIRIVARNEATSNNGGFMALQTYDGTSAYIDALTLDRVGDATFYNDIKMPSGAVLNFNSSDVTLTHSANTLTLAGGTLVLPSGTAASTEDINDSIQVYLANAEEGVAVADTLSGGIYYTQRQVDSLALTIGSVYSDNTLTAIQELGSPILALPVAPSYYAINASDLTDSTVYLIAVYLPEDATITGIRMSMGSATGNFTISPTADNLVGLYSQSGGTLTRVAVSADDDNLWKPTAYTAITKAFTAPYEATAGVYWAAFCYNALAQTTAPKPLYMTNGFSTLINTALGVGTAGSIRLCATINGNTLPASLELIDCTNSTIQYFIALY